MQKALRIFLRTSRPGFKIVENTSSDPRFQFLQTLETIAQSMGSEIKAIYKVFEALKPQIHMTH